MDSGSEQHAAANLLGSGPAAPATRQKSRWRNVKVLSAVFLACLLALVLAIVLVVKLHCGERAAQSCKRRCSSRGPDAEAECRCDAACVGDGTCCLDYEEVCVEPSKVWTCSKFRCGEERLPSDLCSCSSHCEEEGDCCANYRSTCEGDQTWLDEACEDVEAPLCPAGFSKPPLLLVSLDGFRAGYLTAYGSLMPVISKLRKCGTSTPHLRPAYPTKTFPNHYTIVTGLYPESHGIVDNKMYDVTRNASFSLKLDEKFNPQWYQGEPVWITAMKNKLKTASFFWPGSDVPVGGQYPDFWVKYDSKIPFEKRIATVLEWLGLPEGQRPDFYTLYFDEPDSAGHRFGPASSEVIQALLKVDRLMGLLMEGLKQRRLHTCVNLILLSDHGMEEASSGKVVYLSDYLDNTEAFSLIQGPAPRVRPRRLPEQFFSFDYAGLVKNLSCREPNQPMKPYLKEHLPKRLHFASSVRIEPALLYMQEQWQAALKKGELKYNSGGFHGSDNTFTNMQAIFMGYGPGLRQRTSVAPFENIEVYNLLCDLLHIPPAPNNGSHGSLNHLLRRPPHQPANPAQRSPASTCTAEGVSTGDARGCTCHSPEQTEVQNQRLLERSLDVRPVHLPFGAPRVVQQGSDHCLLQQGAYVSGYSRDLLMPLWVSYSLGAAEVLRPSGDTCVRADVRVQARARPSCSIYRNNSTLTFGLLHPPHFAPADAESDSLITSNMVPMFPAFKEIWSVLHGELLVKFSRDLNGLNVVSGPVFDRDFDGIYDIMNEEARSEAPVPSHFFLVVSSCWNSSLPVLQCEGALDASAFLLPHRADRLETCHNGSDFSWLPAWLRLHAARVRDVELVTGLSFYPDRVSVPETLQLKTRLKTF